jgi:hypothetical protein
MTQESASRVSIARYAELLSADVTTGRVRIFLTDGRAHAENVLRAQACDGAEIEVTALST